MMRGTGRPVIVPKEVIEAPLRIPNHFKNQIKTLVTSNLSTANGSTSNDTKSSPSGQGSGVNASKKFESGLSKLDILFSGPMEDLVIYRILDVLIFKDARTEEDLNALATHMTEMTLSDSSNIVPICKYVFLFSLLPGKGEKLRSFFFTCLQKVFEEKRHSLKGTPKYGNFSRFLMASVHYNRNPLVPVADIFVTSCLTLLQEMRDLTQDDEIRAEVEMFVRCAQYARDSSTDFKSQLLGAKFAIRNNLIQETLSTRARQWLMLALECSDGVISQDAYTYYGERVGAEAVSSLRKTDFQIVVPKGDADRFPITKVKMDKFVAFI